MQDQTDADSVNNDEPQERVSNSLQSPPKDWVSVAYQVIQDINLKQVVTSLLVIFSTAIVAIPVILLYKQIFPEFFPNHAPSARMLSIETEYALVSSNAVFSHSGITVAPGEVVRIRATGRTTSALHHIVNHAQADTQPLEAWCGPKGHDKIMHDTVAKRLRFEKRRCTDANIGALLMLPTKAGTVKDKNERPESKEYIPVNEGVTWTNSYDHEIELVFCVNDILLNSDESSEAAYAGRKASDFLRDTPSTESHTPSQDEKQKASDRHKNLTSQWDTRISAGYFHLWYDDNCGSYLVQVRR